MIRNTPRTSIPMTRPNRFDLENLEPRVFLDASPLITIQNQTMTLRWPGVSIGEVFQQLYDAGVKFHREIGPGPTIRINFTYVPPTAEDSPSPQAPVEPQENRPTPATQVTARAEQRIEQRVATPEAPSPQFVRTVLADQAAAKSTTPVSPSALATTAFHAAATLAGAVTKSVTFVMATPLANAPAIAANNAAAPAGARVLDFVPPDASLPSIAKNTGQAVVSLARGFTIAEFGSPFRLLADSLAAFADESASIPTLSSSTSRGTAWTVTTTVIAADLFLAAYAYHRTRQRRQVQTAHVKRQATTAPW